MLRRKFELIPIKFEFSTNFLSCSKIWPNTLYYSTGSLAKFHQKWQGENSPFLLGTYKLVPSPFPLPSTIQRLGSLF